MNKKYAEWDLEDNKFYILLNELYSKFTESPKVLKKIN